MRKHDLRIVEESTTRVIASSGNFQIEYFEKVGSNDYEKLIQISKALAEEYGKMAILTHGTIQRYFNRKGSSHLLHDIEVKSSDILLAYNWRP